MKASLAKIFVLLAAVALLAAACSSGSGSTDVTEAASGDAFSVDLKLTDFKITPEMIDVPTGMPVTFNIANEGSTPHSFAVTVDGQSFDSGEIQAGSTGTLELDALDAGSYEAICSVPGHKDLGMKAMVMAADGVSADGAAGGDTSSGSMDMSNMTAAEMANMHKQGVVDFLAGKETNTVGGQVIAPEKRGDASFYHLTVSQIKWEVSKGVFKDAMAFNNMVPGPEIHAQLGEKIQIKVDNQMDQPFVLHFHGLTVPNAMDGVPYVTQDAIMPGGSFVYEFTIKDPPGMYVYHSHFNSTEQVGAGLYGAIIIDPKSGQWPYRTATVNAANGALSYGSNVQVDKEYSMFLGDGPLGYVLNGKSFPATAPLVASKGDWVLLHLANDGSMLHPMHLHGYHFEVVNEDGFPLQAPYMADTLVIAPGQRFDVLIHAEYPGAWAFHCHILPHVEGPQGMYGMVTALVVQ